MLTFTMYPLLLKGISNSIIQNKFRRIEQAKPKLIADHLHRRWFLCRSRNAEWLRERHPAEK